MDRPCRVLAWLTAGLLLLAPAAGARAGQEAGETPAPGPRREVYRPATSGPLISFTAFLPPRGRITLQPIAVLSRERAQRDAAGRVQPLAPGELQRTTALTLFVEAGLLARLSVGAQATMLHVRRRVPPQEASSSGVGDTLLFARGTLVREAPDWVPETVLLGQVKLPTGQAESAGATLLQTDVRGSGAVDLTAGLNLSKGLRPLLLHADVLFTHALPTHLGGVEVRYGQTLAWSVAAEWPVLPRRLALMLELSGRHQTPPTQETVRQRGAGVDDVLLGVGVELLFSQDVQLLVGVQRTLWGRNEAAIDALTATLVPTVPFF